jgi:hypothetical protein
VALAVLTGLVALGLSRSVLALPASAEAPALARLGASAPVLGWVGLGLLTVGGFVTLALVTVYFHLLSITASDNVYALPGLPGGTTLCWPGAMEAGGRPGGPALSVMMPLGFVTVIMSGAMFDVSE